jgi:hypothetical protein
MMNIRLTIGDLGSVAFRLYFATDREANEWQLHWDTNGLKDLVCWTYSGTWESNPYRYDGTIWLYDTTDDGQLVTTLTLENMPYDTRNMVPRTRATPAEQARSTTRGTRTVKTWM